MSTFYIASVGPRDAVAVGFALALRPFLRIHYTISHFTPPFSFAATSKLF